MAAWAAKRCNPRSKNHRKMCAAASAADFDEPQSIRIACSNLFRPPVSDPPNYQRQKKRICGFLVTCALILCVAGQHVASLNLDSSCEGVDVCAFAILLLLQGIAWATSGKVTTKLAHEVCSPLGFCVLCSVIETADFWQTLLAKSIRLRE